MGILDHFSQQEIRLLAKKARKLADQIGFQFIDSDDPEVTPLTLTNDCITPDTWFQTPVTPVEMPQDLPPSMLNRRTSSTPAIRLVRSEVKVSSPAMGLAKSQVQLARMSTASTSSSRGSSASTLTVASTSSTRSTISTASFLSHISSFNALDNAQVERLMQYVTNPIDKQLLNRLHHLNADREASFAQLRQASPRFFERALRRGVPLEDTLKAYILAMDQGREDLIEYSSSSSAGGMKMVNNLEHRKKIAKHCLCLSGS
jgi:hypothetical protein